MPLSKSKSKQAFVHNVKAELAAGKPRKQALAIAYSVQRNACNGGRMNPYADGGAIPFGVRESAKQFGRSGLISSPTLGRADKVSGAVRAGSYVMPADVVSAMGQGNTAAGARALNGLMSSSPYGAAVGRPPRARGMTSKRMKRFADGGAATEEFPVNLSGGEFVFPPEAVAAFGGGDIDHGHQILDALVKEVRRKNIKHISSLPPPRKD